VNDLERLSLAELIGKQVKLAGEGGSTMHLSHEIHARLLVVADHAHGASAGLHELHRALYGANPTFAQILDQIMEAMDAAGVSDAQGTSGSSAEEREQEPNRARAWELRELLMERYGKLGGATKRVLDGTPRLLDGRS
jgi:hypothetical protein